MWLVCLLLSGVFGEESQVGGDARPATQMRATVDVRMSEAFGDAELAAMMTTQQTAAPALDPMAQMLLDQQAATTKTTAPTNDPMAQMLLDQQAATATTAAPTNDPMAQMLLDQQTPTTTTAAPANDPMAQMLLDQQAATATTAAPTNDPMAQMLLDQQAATTTTAAPTNDPMAQMLLDQQAATATTGAPTNDPMAQMLLDQQKPTTTTAAPTIDPMAQMLLDQQKVTATTAAPTRSPAVPEQTTAPTTYAELLAQMTAGTLPPTTAVAVVADPLPPPSEQQLVRPTTAAPTTSAAPETAAPTTYEELLQQLLAGTAPTLTTAAPTTAAPTVDPMQLLMKMMASADEDGAAPAAAPTPAPTTAAPTADPFLAEMGIASLHTEDPLLSQMGAGATTAAPIDPLMAQVLGIRQCPADCLTWFDGCGDCVCSSGIVGNCDVAANGCIATPAYCKQRLADLVTDAVKASADAQQAAQHAAAEHGLLAQLQAQAVVAVADETQLKDELHAAMSTQPDASDIAGLLQAEHEQTLKQQELQAAQAFADSQVQAADEQLDVVGAADAQAAAIGNLAMDTANQALIAQVAGLHDVSPGNITDPEAALIANMQATEAPTTLAPTTAAQHEALRAATGQIDGVSGGVVKECSGHIDPTTDMAAFVGCTQINGYLDIQGTALTNLDALRDVRYMVPDKANGALGIVIRDNCALTDLSGLSSLHVNLTSGLVLENNCQLAALDGLCGVEAVGATGGGEALVISNNSALRSTEGLCGVGGALQGSLVVQGNPNLELLLGLERVSALGADGGGNSLVLQHNAVLRSIEGLRNCTSMQGAVLIADNGRLQRLEGLRALRTISGRNAMGDALAIFENKALADLTGLNSLHGRLQGAIAIERNAALSNLDALAGVSGVARGNAVGNAVDLQENGNLTSIRGLSGLAGALGGALTIKDNGNLTTIDGLQGITSIAGQTLAAQALVIDGNVALTSLDGLTNAGGAIAGGITVANSPSLSSIGALLNGSHAVSSAASLSITGVQCVSRAEKAFVDALCAAGGTACDGESGGGFLPLCAQLAAGAAATVATGEGPNVICGGSTTAGADWGAWSLYGSTGLFIDVNGTDCAFASTPVWVSSVEGDSAHWQLSGVSSIYEPTRASFRLYTWHPVLRGAFLKYYATRYKWRVSWMGGQGRHTGRTTAGASGWADVEHAPSTVVLGVNARGCGYRGTPAYVASLHGDYDHWRAFGVHTLYYALPSGFRVYVTHAGSGSGDFTALEAERRRWSVQWIGSEDRSRSGHSGVDWSFYCASTAMGGEGGAYGSGDGCDDITHARALQHAIIMDVDTSGSSYDVTPTYVSSVSGVPMLAHLAVTGGAAIFRASRSAFRVYLDKGPTAYEAKQAGWAVNYIGYHTGRRAERPYGVTGGGVGAAHAMLEQLYPTGSVRYETTVTLGLRLETKASLQADRAKRMILRAAVGVALGANYTDVTLTKIKSHGEATQQRLAGHALLHNAGVLVTCSISTPKKAHADAMEALMRTPRFGAGMEKTFEELLNKYGYTTRLSNEVTVLSEASSILISGSSALGDGGGGGGAPAFTKLTTCSHIRCKYLELYARETHHIAVVHDKGRQEEREQHGDQHRCSYNWAHRTCACTCWRSRATTTTAAPTQMSNLLRGDDDEVASLAAPAPAAGGDDDQAPHA
jgi:hypothetical protein